MRIPPLYRRKGYQRFFAGIIIGIIIGWSFFMLSYGELQDDYIKLIREKDNQIGKLKNTIDHYQDEDIQKNKEIEKKLRIQEIDITFLNQEKIKLVGLSKIELEKSIHFQLHDLLTKDIESVSKHTNLIVKALENKTFIIENEKFQVKVYQMHLYTTLRLYLNVERVK